MFLKKNCVACLKAELYLIIKNFIPNIYGYFFFQRYTMLPLTVGFVDQMLNLSKNGIKLLSTHSVVGIEPVWIFSQIFVLYRVLNSPRSLCI